MDSKTAFTQFATQLFHETDADKSGYVEEGELRILLAKMGEKMSKQIPQNIVDQIVDEWLTARDQDGDNRIDVEEFQEVADYVYNLLQDEANRHSLQERRSKILAQQAQLKSVKPEVPHQSFYERSCAISNTQTQLEQQEFKEFWGKGRKKYNINQSCLNLNDSALWEAVGEQDMTLIKQKIKLGANVNMINLDGLDLGQYSGKQQCLDQLETSKGKSLLHHAAFIGNLTVFKYLVDQGAHVTKGLQDKWEHHMGDTPFHFAAIFGRFDIIVYCVEHGVDVNQPGNLGYTMLHYAAQRGHVNVCKYLVDMEANIDAKNKNGKKPVDLVKNLETQKILNNAAQAWYQVDQNKQEYLAKHNDCRKDHVKDSIYGDYNAWQMNKKQYTSQTINEKQQVTYDKFIRKNM